MSKICDVQPYYIIITTSHLDIKMRARGSHHLNIFEGHERDDTYRMKALKTLISVNEIIACRMRRDEK